jgi:hypothetical protein
MILGYPNMISLHDFEELGYTTRRIKNMQGVR